MFRKSQIAVTDLIIALSIYVILILFVVFTWNRYTMILQDDFNYNVMEITAFQVTDLLVKSGGEPEDWEKDPGSVEVIGLASFDRNISAEKVDAFLNNISYRNASKLLGTAYYNFYFQIKHINGTRLREYGISSTNRSVVNVQRLVSYKNEKAMVEFALWR